jgi:hypothetical protein
MKMAVTSNGKFDMIKNRTVARVFEDLDVYREFCVEYGYIFNEKDLYKRNTAYGQYERAKRGDRVINNWDEDVNYMLNAPRRARG